MGTPPTDLPDPLDSTALGENKKFVSVWKWGRTDIRRLGMPPEPKKVRDPEELDRAGTMERDDLRMSVVLEPWDPKRSEPPRSLCLDESGRKVILYVTQ